jgi:hypothetical protein
MDRLTDLENTVQALIAFVLTHFDDHAMVDDELAEATAQIQRNLIAALQRVSEAE